MTLDEQLKDWYAVFPGSEKLDLGPKRPIAYFKLQIHAEEFVKRYNPYGYVEQDRRECVDEGVKVESHTRDRINHLIGLYQRNKR